MKKTKAVKAFIKKYKNPKHAIRITSSHNCVHPYGEPSFPLTYIQLNNHKIKHTKKISDRVYIDFDRRNQVVGVEII